MEIIEDALGDLSVHRCRSSAEVVEVTIKPVINFFVDGVVMIANFFGSLALLLGFSFGGCPVFVSAAEIDTVVICKAAVPSINISG